MHSEVSPVSPSDAFNIFEFSTPNLRVIDALLRASPDVVMVHDREGRFIYIGVTAAKVIGLSPEDILGRTVRELGFPTMLPARLDKNRMQVFMKGLPLSDAITILTAEGLRHYEYTFSPVGDTEREISAVLCIGRDVTEQIVAQSERRMLAAIVDSSEDAIFSTDLHGIILSWNRAAEMVLGYTANEIIGKPQLLLFPADRWNEEAESFRRIRAGERTEHFETTRLRKDGSLIDVSVTISPIRGANGEITEASKIIRDITPQKRAERERRHSEARYHALSQAITQILWVSDATGHILDIAPGWFAFTGQSEEEAKGRGWAAAVHPEDVEKYIETMRLSTALKTPYECHVRIRRQDGVYRKMVSRGVPILDDAGQVMEWVGTCDDITDALQAQKEQQLLAEIVNTSDDAIISKDLDGIITSWNHAAETIFGYTADEIIGKQKSLLFPYDRLSEEIEILHRIRAGERAEHFETVRRRKDGSLIDVSVTITPIRDAGGAITGGSAIIRDISAQKQAERAHLEAEAKLYAILDNAPISIYTKDRQTRYTFINRKAETLLPVPREEALGCTNFSFYTEEYAAQFQADDRQVLESGNTVTKEANYLLPDGRHDFIILKFPLYDATHAVYALCGIATDVTERKQLEAQLYQSQKMEGIGRLAGGIAHDFNNLLTAIVGYTELAEMDTPPESPVQRHLQTVQQAAQSAAALTKQLLAFARKQILQTQVFSLNDLIVETDKMLRRVIGEDVELVTLISPDLRMVRADPNQITQVLVNLAVNARDAMPSGGRLTIETENVYLDAEYARYHAEVQPGSYIMLAVGDTGTGMSDDVKRHLFEPFFTTKETGKGTGLGLATCYGIVKQNGGHIWVYSEIEHGTTFKVYLPVTDEPAAALPKMETSTDVPTGTETVLVAEDEPLLRALATDILQAQGYQVLVATNGSDALRMAAEFPEEIHLLLTDVVMPHMGGRELSQRLQAVRPGIKVLFVSGYTENSIVHHGILDAGITFLQKPYTPSVLAHKVRDVLDTRE